MLILWAGATRARGWDEQWLIWEREDSISAVSVSEKLFHSFEELK